MFRGSNGASRSIFYRLSFSLRSRGLKTCHGTLDRLPRQRKFGSSRQFAFLKKEEKHFFEYYAIFFPTSVCIKRKRKSLWLWVVAKKLDHFFRCTSSQRHTGTFHLPKVSDIFVIACWPWETSFDSWIKSFLLLIRLSMLRFGFPVEKGVSDAVSSGRQIQSEPTNNTDVEVGP